MDWASIYGLATLIVVGLAALSRDQVCLALALVFGAAWFVTNQAVAVLGFTHAPLMIPSFDAVAALCVAMIGARHRSRLALDIFILYAVVLLWHIVAFVTRIDGSYQHYLVANLLFAAQLALVGGHSGWRAVYHWTLGRGERARAGPARRADMEAKKPKAPVGGLIDAIAGRFFAGVFSIYGCPAVLRGRRDRSSWVLRRAVYRNCTAANLPERCLSYTDGRVANRACAAYCPHLRAGVRNSEAAGRDILAHPA